MTCRREVAFAEMKVTCALVPMMSCCEELKSGVSFSGGIPPCSDLVSVFLTHLSQTHTPTHTVQPTVQLFDITDACGNNLFI